MVLSLARLHPPVECIRLHDAESGLDGVIAIHSTVRGPGAGGCRLWHYPDLDAAVGDAMRLAEGMSYKNALAGLPFGGAKAVLRRPDEGFDRAALFRAFGRAVEELKGQYITAEDVGTTVADMEEVASVSRHVSGLRPTVGGAGGDPSPWTAKGVFESMRVAARFALGRDLKGLTVAVQGTGNVGAELCRRLADAGAKLVIADPNPSRRDRLKHILGAKVVSTLDIASVKADVFAPCALGGVLDRPAVEAMQAKIVCGGANNQLASPDIAGLMLERGILYAPDYAVNAGGIICVAAEYLGETRPDVANRVAQIAPRLGAIFERAKIEKCSPAAIADAMAEDVIVSTERLAA